MARKTFYSQASHSVVIDEFIDVQDFAEDEEAIAFEPEGDANSVQRGLDRNMVNFGSRRAGILTLKLKPTSPTIDTLDELIRAQDNGNPRLLTATVRTGVDDVLNLVDAAIEEAGFGTGGTQAGLRTYILKAANYEKALVA